MSFGSGISAVIDQIVSIVGSRVLHKHQYSEQQILQQQQRNIWKIPSTVDWCEPNYQVSSYIAEFFNTFSSFAMIICGLMGVYLHRKGFEKRFLAAFATVAIVGIY